MLWQVWVCDVLFVCIENAPTTNVRQNYSIPTDHVLLAWGVFTALTVLHVWANVRAMRCLVLTSLNVPRLELLLDSYVTRVSHLVTW